MKISSPALDYSKFHIHHVQYTLAECDLFQLNQSKLLNSVLKQVEKDATACCLFPMVVLKRNRNKKRLIFIKHMGIEPAASHMVYDGWIIFQESVLAIPLTAGQ